MTPLSSCHVKKKLKSHLCAVVRYKSTSRCVEKPPRLPTCWQSLPSGPYWTSWQSSLCVLSALYKHTVNLLWVLHWPLVNFSFHVNQDQQGGHCWSFWNLLMTLRDNVFHCRISSCPKKHRTLEAPVSGSKMMNHVWQIFFLLKNICIHPLLFSHGGWWNKTSQRISD